MMIQEKMKNKRNKKKIGYSLIEALVALGILLIGIVPVVTVATQAILFHHRASETEEASRISQTMIDYIKSRGYDNLNVLPGKKYKLKSTSDGAFTIDTSLNDFGKDIVIKEEDSIPNNLILLNSKGINLSQVNFYLVMDMVKGNLKDSDEDSDSYTDPITDSDTSNVYRDDLIYGEFIFGMGKITTDPNKKTDRETELKTTFIMTPIENWK